MLLPKAPCVCVCVKLVGEKESICVSPHFCDRMCTKCWLTAFWVMTPPPFPRDRFVAWLIYPARHTGMTFPSMSIYPAASRGRRGGRIGFPFELVVLQSLASREEISNSLWCAGWEWKKAACLCVIEMLAWCPPIGICHYPQTALQKAIAALQLCVKGQNSLCAPASGDGTLGSQQCWVN